MADAEQTNVEQVDDAPRAKQPAPPVGVESLPALLRTIAHAVQVAKYGGHTDEEVSKAVDAGMASPIPDRPVPLATTGTYGGSPPQRRRPPH